jgi:hypothetical protein
MFESTTDHWPAYPLGPASHIHALGVIAINYNSLEQALFVLLREYLGTHHILHAQIFQALNTTSILALFTAAVELHERDDALKERLVAFCPLFGTCFTNRNLLMHANVREADATDVLLALAKRSKRKPHIFNDLRLTLPELRQIADDIRTVFTYAFRLWNFILKRARRVSGWPEEDQPVRLPALPDIPSGLIDLQVRLQPTQ